MTLVDAGPLVALIDARETHHARCVAAYNDLRTPIVTTWPAFTEAMYLLWQRARHPGQASLWKFLATAELVIADLNQDMVSRTAQLMAKYADQPMDLADASLVALAEALDDDEIFTLDDDFLVYRMHGRRAFKIIPS